MKYVTQLCQRTLLGQHLPQNTVKIFYRMQIIVSIFITHQTTHQNPKIIPFSAF